MDAACLTVRTIAGLLLAALLLTPSTTAHEDAPIGLEAREGDNCLESELCLELVSLPPDLEPGHATSLQLRVHPNASQAYTAAITTLDEADPDREDTPTSTALATTPAAEPGQTVHVNLTGPQASHAYVWLTEADHEARGGWETFPLGMQNADGSEGERSADGVTTAAAFAIASLVARRQRRS